MKKTGAGRLAELGPWTITTVLDPAEACVTYLCVQPTLLARNVGSASRSTDAPNYTRFRVTMHESMNDEPSGFSEKRKGKRVQRNLISFLQENVICIPNFFLFLFLFPFPFPFLFPFFPFSISFSLVLDIDSYMTG